MQDILLVLLAATKYQKLKRLLRINFKDLSNNYEFVQELRLNKGTLVCYQKSYL